MKKDTMNQRRKGKSCLGQQLVSSPPGSLNPPPAAERIGVTSPGGPMPITKPALGSQGRFLLLQTLAGATSEQHQHHPHRQRLGGCLFLLPAWFVVMLATAALLDSRLRSETPLTASTQKE